MRDKFKGTKGNWLDTTGTFETDLHMVVGNGVICDIRKSLPLNEQVANAKLIANAPELLNGLIHALEMCEDRFMPTENDLTIMAGRIKSIINKALS